MMIEMEVQRESSGSYSFCRLMNQNLQVRLLLPYNGPSLVLLSQPFECAEAEELDLLQSITVHS